MLRDYFITVSSDVLKNLSISATPQLIDSEGFLIARLTAADINSYWDMVDKMAAIAAEFKFLLPNVTDVAIMPPTGSTMQPVLMKCSNRVI
jgi:hypothetical protein